MEKIFEITRGIGNKHLTNLFKWNNIYNLITREEKMNIEVFCESLKDYLRLKAVEEKGKSKKVYKWFCEELRSKKEEEVIIPEWIDIDDIKEIVEFINIYTMIGYNLKLEEIAKEKEEKEDE